MTVGDPGRSPVEAGGVEASLAQVERAGADARRSTDAALAGGRTAVSIGLEYRHALLASTLAELDRDVPAALLARMPVARDRNVARSPAAAARGRDVARSPASAADDWNAARSPAAAARDAADPPGEARPPAEELARVRRLRDHCGLARGLAAVLPRLDPDDRPAVAAEAVTLARGLRSALDRSRALADLAPYLPADVLAEAVDAATRTGGWELPRLVPHLPAGLLPVALARAHRLNDPNSRTRALLSLLPRVAADQRPALLARALTAARAVSSGSGADRATALTAVAAHLPAGRRPEVLGEALAAARTIDQSDESRYSFPAVLGGLARSLPAERLGEAAAVAADIIDEHVRAASLVAVAAHAPDATLPALLGTVRGLGRAKRCFVLGELAARLPADRLAETLAVARAFGDEPGRAAALAALAAFLPATDRPAVFATAIADAAGGLREPRDRAWALALIAPHLPVADRRPVLAAALDAAASAEAFDTCDNAQLMTALGPQLPGDLLDRALAVPWCDLGDVLAALAPHLDPDQLSRALDLVIDHTWWQLDDEQARVLAAVSPRLPAHRLDAAVTQLQHIDCGHYRAEVLAALGPRLPAGQVAALHAAARAEPDRGDRVELVARLATCLPAADRAAALAGALADARAEERPAHRVALLHLLIPALAAHERPPVLRDLLAAIPGCEPQHAARFLIELLPALPPEDRPATVARAMAAAEAIPDALNRVRMLVSMAPHLPADHTATVLAAVAAVDPRYAGERALALAALAASLPAALLPDALALAGAAPDLPGQSRATLDRAGSAVTAVLCRALQLYRSGDDTIALVDLVRAALRGASRGRCLAVTGALAPLVAEVGGGRAVAECVEAIRDIQRWYP